MQYVLLWIILICQFTWATHALSAAPSKLIIGYAAMSARVVPLWIAEEQGILARHGVDSEQVFIRGAPTLVTGLTSGDIHFGSTGGTATLAAIAAGHDLKMVAAFSSRNTYDLVTRPSIKRAEDLRGKRFGVTSIGGTSGWASCFGSSISVSTSSATRSSSRSSVIKAFRCKPSNTAPSTPPCSTAYSAAACNRNASISRASIPS